MKLSASRTLVLMLCDIDTEGEQFIFAGDLYSDNSIIDSVYLDRAAMLCWLTALDAGASRAAVRAMDELVAEPERALRSVPVCPEVSGLPAYVMPASLSLECA